MPRVFAAPLPPPPPADKTDPVALQWATRASIARGVAFLKERAAADPDGWIVPPVRSRRHVGSTNVTMRFSEKRAPLYEYETYTVYERRPGSDSQSARTLVPVQRQRIKRVLDPDGGPVQLVPDRNGPITREVGRPIYEAGGPDVWGFGRIGQNAMALHALRLSGVDADDAVVQDLARKLRDLLQFYGLPDATWDLAWLAAAFARLPGREAEELTQQIGSKLLDGQIVDGEARGLWGPSCIHVPLLACAYAREQDLATRLQKAQLAAKEKPGERNLAKAVAEAESALNGFQQDMRRISQLALSFDQVDAPHIRLGDDATPPLIVCGLPDYIFNQTSADMDSTALALFALREVARARRMPEETWRPSMEGVRAAPPAERADAVLARTAHALARLQQPDGGWTASNLHQPVTVFERFGKMIPGIPVDPKSFKPLPSPQTLLSSLEGFSALVDTARIVGFAKVLGRFQPALTAGMARARAAASALPDARPETLAGGLVPPFDACFHAGAAGLMPGSLLQEGQAAETRMRFDVVSRQQKDGSWTSPGGKSVLLTPSSMRARLETLDRAESKNKTKVMNRSVAHVRGNWWGAGWQSAYVADAPALATSYALAFLAGSARPPVAVCRWGEGVPLPATPELALRGLAEATGADWRYVELKWPLPLDALEVAPMLFISGKGSFAADAETRRALTAFFRKGGFAIAQAAATPEGQAFLQTAGQALASCGEAGPLGDVAADARVLGDLAGKLGRSFKGALRKDGSLVVVLMPVADAGVPVDGAFAPAQAVKLTQSLMERNLDAPLLAADYPSNLAGLGDATNVYASAMDILRGTVRREPAPAPEPAPAASAPAAPAAVQSAPAPEAPPAKRAPAADETW